ncbi:unnamed protein product [Caenorhabditis nigoni]
MTGRPRHQTNIGFSGQKKGLLETTLCGSNGFESCNDVSMNDGRTTDNQQIFLPGQLRKCCFGGQRMDNGWTTSKFFSRGQQRKICFDDVGRTSDEKWTDNEMDNQQIFLSRTTEKICFYGQGWTNDGQRTDNGQRTNFPPRTDKEKQLFRWTNDGQPMDNRQTMDKGPIFLYALIRRKNCFNGDGWTTGNRWTTDNGRTTNKFFSLGQRRKMCSELDGRTTDKYGSIQPVDRQSTQPTDSRPS